MGERSEEMEEMEERSEAAMAPYENLSGDKEERSEAAMARYENLSGDKEAEIIKEGEREMEEMRDAAMAYYENLTERQKQQANELFNAMDTNGDENVNVKEYLDFLEVQNFSEYVPQNLFKFLDKNGDGMMDFEEFITLYYIVEVRHGIIKCDGCGGNLWGLYFLCVKCYEAGDRTHNLCCKCYRKKNIKHEHSIFLDNYALLNRMQPTKKKPTQGNISREDRGRRSNTQTENTSEQVGVNRSTSKTQKAKEAFNAFNKSIGISGTVKACNSCTTM